MVIYYEGFDHTNSSDDEEEVATITSTAEEPKRLKEIKITQRLTNDTLLYAYLEREKIIDGVPIEASPMNENPYVFALNLDIPVGQTFVLKLKNQSAGSNGGIVGHWAYEITG